VDVQHHVIRREILEVDLSGSEADGFAVQRRIGELCRDRLGPALDAAFARIVPPGEHWILERLEIDAGSFSLEGLDGFVEAVARAAEGQIQTRSDGRSARAAPAEGPTAPGSPAAQAQEDEIARRMPAGAAHDALAQFLATGALPWWFRLEPGERLDEAVLDTWEATGAVAEQARALMRQVRTGAMRLRLARQFTAPFLEMLLDSTGSAAGAAAREVLRAVSRQGAAEAVTVASDRLWRIATMADGLDTPGGRVVAGWLDAMRADAVCGAPSVAEIEQLWDAAQATNVPPAPLALAAHPLPMQPPAAPAPASGLRLSLDLTEGLYVEAAGLVLLHPFLPRLFEGLGIAAGNELVGPERALRLLHFLATGERHGPEHALLLPKLLCNLPPDALAGAPDRLTVAEEDEATALLQAAIGHWEALGSSSPGALRGTFLVRPGKLSRRDEDDLLQVEPQSFDVLLDRLPWGIGAVRLPWMLRILWVEWG
jgi:hypothetical protein